MGSFTRSFVLQAAVEVAIMEMDATSVHDTMVELADGFLMSPEYNDRDFDTMMETVEMGYRLARKNLPVFYVLSKDKRGNEFTFFFAVKKESVAVERIRKALRPVAGSKAI